MGGMYGGKAGQKTFSGPGDIPTPDQLLARFKGEEKEEVPVIVGPLSDTERVSLAEHEAIIERGLNTFKEVGDALMAIRDGREYREEYASFEDYLLTRWNMRRNYANKLIDAAKVVENLQSTNEGQGTIVPLPENEAQARELAKLEDPDQVLAWKTVVETAVATGGKVTAGYVREVADTLKEIRDTGHLTYGEEAALPASEIVQAKLTEAARELMLRQQEHIKQGRKDKREERLENIRIASNLSDLQKLYPVIYADPPWRYEHSKTHSRDIENQYPTMALEDICALPVADMTPDHAILFMWATAPKLEEAMQVIRAWGFTYRTCMVWDKELMGMGYWTRVQHELLLIAVKGDFPVPEEENRVRSVYREQRGEHSAKPDYYRDLIERMYPDMGRIELFARQSDRPDRWDVWGNEVEQL